MTMTNTHPADNAMQRKLFIEMTVQEQDDFIEGIRTRRLRSVEKHKEHAALKQLAKDERTEKMIDHESKMMEKEIDRLTKALAAVEARAVRISGLKAMVEAEQ